jgi:hypothetical protein
MNVRRYAAALLLLNLFVSPIAIFAQQTQPAQPSGQAQQAPARDPNDPIEKIKDEGLNRSQVMATLSYLSDVIGPRLTASPNMKRANEWTRDQLTKWGLQNGHLEPWGPFGRGWSLKRFSAQVTDPQAIPLIAYPKAWSPGFDAPLNAEVVYVDARTEADLEKFKGKLKGKIVFTAPLRDVAAHFEAQGTRLNEKELLTLADAPEPRPQGRGNFRPGNAAAAFQLASAKMRMFDQEGAALLVDPWSRRRRNNLRSVSQCCSSRSGNTLDRTIWRTTSTYSRLSRAGQGCESDPTDGVGHRALQSHRSHATGGRTCQDGGGFVSRIPGCGYDGLQHDRRDPRYRS